MYIRNYTMGLDTIAGAKLLRVKFGAAAAFQPDQAVMHEGHRARLIRVSRSDALIRRCGDSRALAVPLDSLSQPPQLRPGGTPRRTQRSLPVTRSLTRRSASAANWSLAHTARPRVTII
jgi:hypothetical protein